MEKDRRTLDFLLATRLSNAEIVLGKLAACMTFLAAEFAVGLPIMLLLQSAGGDRSQADLAGLRRPAHHGVFHDRAGHLGLDGATNARDRRQRLGPVVDRLADRSLVCVSMVFPRVGIRLPGFLLTANAWVLTSSPLGLMFKIGGGVTPSSGLVDAVAWMSGLQVAGGALLVIWAIARLRSAYRRNVSGDSQSLAAPAHSPGLALAPQTAGRRRSDPLEGNEPFRAGLLARRCSVC